MRRAIAALLCTLASVAGAQVVIQDNHLSGFADLFAPYFRGILTEDLASKASTNLLRGDRIYHPREPQPDEPPKIPAACLLADPPPAHCSKAWQNWAAKVYMKPGGGGVGGDTGAAATGEACITRADLQAAVHTAVQGAMGAAGTKTASYADHFKISRREMVSARSEGMSEQHREKYENMRQAMQPLLDEHMKAVQDPTSSGQTVRSAFEGHQEKMGALAKCRITESDCLQ